jgi:GTP-binding protein YchF
MQVGILGWPGSGKSTLFAALTGRVEDLARIHEAATAVIHVPDARVERLAAMYSPRKTTHAEVVFVDPGADRSPCFERPSFPEPLLEAVRNVDALALVVRDFDDPSVPRPPGSATAERDLESIEQELILRDLERVEKRLERLRKEGNRPEGAAERALLEKLQGHLEGERPLRETEWSRDQWARLRGFQFLSVKPAVVVFNVGEGDIGREVSPAAERTGRAVLPLCAKIECELVELEAGERAQFLEQLGLTESARDAFVRTAYRLLDLVSFFTVGEDEVRASPVRRGSTAPVAAGKIHTDLQKGFIRAEVIHYDDFTRVGSMSAAKADGVLRLEGKNYQVQDGDIMHVRHS